MLLSITRTNLACVSDLKSVLVIAALSLLGCGGGGGGDGNDSGGVPKRTPTAVFFVTENDAELIAVADDGTGMPVVLSNGVDFTSIGYIQATPAPDGRRVLMFGLALGDSINHNYVRNADGSNLHRVSSVINPTAGVNSATWSPNSRSLAYVADGDTPGTPELYLVNADGTNHQKINQALNAGEYVSLVAFPSCWSPDSRYIAYRIMLGSTAVAVSVYDTQTTTTARVASGDADAPMWAPDSQTLAYLRKDYVVGPSGNEPAFQVYILDPDGSNHVLANGTLSSTIFLDSFEWSPDSRHLAQLFRHRRQTISLKRAKLFINVYDTQDVSGSPSRRVHDFWNNGSINPNNTSICYDICGFKWSQAGTELAYLSDAATQDFVELYSYNVATDTSQLIDHGISNVMTPVSDVYRSIGWSSNDDYVFYQGGYPGFTTAQTGFANISTGTGTLFTNNVRNYVWNTDHTVFYYARRELASLDQTINLRTMNTPSQVTTFNSTTTDITQTYLTNLYMAADDARVLILTWDVATGDQVIQSLNPDTGNVVPISSTYNVLRVVDY